MPEESRAARRARRRTRRTQPTSTGSNWRIAVVGALLVAAIAIVAVAFTGLPGDENGSSPNVVAAEGPPESIQTDGRTMGDPNAPVHLVEWGNYK